VFDVEVLDAEAVASDLSQEAIVQAVESVLKRMPVSGGHLAVQFVDKDRITELNLQFRGKEGGTDVLSFPLDGVTTGSDPKELGDVVICPELTVDIREAVVHGCLHLLGMDHETDNGEMLELQREIVRELVKGE